MKTLTTVLLLMTLAACGSNPPVSHVGVFAQSAESVADAMIKTLEDVNQSGVNQRKASLATRNQQIDGRVFQGAFDDSKAFEDRLNAIGQLKKYSSALSELASANFREDIDEASSDLYGSLSGINTAISTLGGPAGLISDTILKGIATAVDAIGSRIVEKKRFRALQEIVTATDPAVQQLSDLIMQDADGFGSELRTNADAIYTDTVTAYYNEFDSLSYSQRLARLDELELLHNKTVLAPTIVNQLSRAAQQMAKAHRSLSSALAKGAYSTPNVLKDIGQLRTEAERLKKFYETLGAE